MRIVIIKIACLLTFFANAQVNTDSLKSIWENKNNHDTVRLNALFDLAWDGYLYSQPDSTFYFAGLQFEYAKKKGLKKYQALALNAQGTAHLFKGNFDKALNLYNECLEINHQTGNKTGIASMLNNIGIIYKNLGNYQKAIECYSNSLKYQDELNDEIGQASSLNNIGNIYADQQEYEKASVYFRKGLKINESIGFQKGIAASLNNLGIVYKEKKEYEKAIQYFERSLKIKKKMGDTQGIASSYVNIGNAYFGSGNISKGFEFLKMSLSLYSEIGDKYGESSALIIIGNMSLKDNLEEAISLGTKAYTIANEIGADMEAMNAAGLLSSAYKKSGNFKLSLEMFEIHIRKRDSLESDENKNEIMRQEFKYSYEKKAIADSVKVSEEKKVIAAKLIQEQTQRYALYVGLFLTLLFAFFMFNRFRVTRRQKHIIEEQKLIVEEQKLIVDEKQKEVMDSIHYAKRIQTALLPSGKYIEKTINKLRK